MRITMQTVHQRILGNLGNIVSDINRINSQISSGKKMSKISEDPVGLVTALGLRTNITQIAQYQKNLQLGDNMISAAETALNSMKELAIRGKELAIQMANGTMTQENRTSAAEEVRHLWEEAIFLANSDVNGRYVFAGYRTAGYSEAEPTPFIADKVDGYLIQGQPLTSLAAAAPVQYNLAAGDLTINGIAIGATVGDGLSSAHATASAAAKVTAINLKQAETGVSADYTAASVTASGAVTAETMDSGELVINGVDIFSAGSANIADNDADNTLVNAINAQSATTGVIASKENGVLTLTAIDGRNIEINTSAGNGEAISHLNGAAADRVYFGTVQLKSDQSFTLQTAAGATEPGLDALGLGGGAAATNEASDVPNDGLLQVITIQQHTGNVRYAGDRNNNIAVKIGPTSNLEVSKNGMDGVMNTGVFSSLKGLENALRAEKYTTVTGTKEAVMPPTNTLDSGLTGLEQNKLAFANGTLSFTVTDHSYYPPRDKTINLEVDIATDTPQSIADRIAQIPGLDASWSTDGHLTIESNDPDRFTFNYEDSSNFMAMNGITQEELQSQAIQKSIGEMGTLLDNLSNQVSDFGARANRIEVQSTLYTNLNLAAQENLSENEDTDMVAALMEIKAKQTAYEAALSAAAQTMQLSLVNFLD